MSILLDPKLGKLYTNVPDFIGNLPISYHYFISEILLLTEKDIIVNSFDYEVKNDTLIKLKLRINENPIEGEIELSEYFDDKLLIVLNDLMKQLFPGETRVFKQLAIPDYDFAIAYMKENEELELAKKGVIWRSNEWIAYSELKNQFDNIPFEENYSVFPQNWIFYKEVYHEFQSSNKILFANLTLNEESKEISGFLKPDLKLDDLDPECDAIEGAIIDDTIEFKIAINNQIKTIAFFKQIDPNFDTSSIKKSISYQQYIGKKEHGIYGGEWNSLSENGDKGTWIMKAMTS